MRTYIVQDASQMGNFNEKSNRIKLIERKKSPQEHEHCRANEIKRLSVSELLSTLCNFHSCLTGTSNPVIISFL